MKWTKVEDGLPTDASIDDLFAVTVLDRNVATWKGPIRPDQAIACGITHWMRLPDVPSDISKAE